MAASGGDEHARELRARAASSAAGRDVEARYRKVEEENKEFADRYIEIEEQNNNLANLYVASYQLHSTLDYQRGRPHRPGDRHQPHRRRGLPHLRRERQDARSSSWRLRRASSAPVTSIGIGEGRSAWRPRRARTSSRPQVAHCRKPTPFDQPIAVIPPEDQGQRDRRDRHQQARWSRRRRSRTMDHELFTLLAGHAATAIFSAEALLDLRAGSSRTLQGFLDMLKTQPAKS